MSLILKIKKIIQTHAKNMDEARELHTIQDSFIKNQVKIEFIH